MTGSQTAAAGQLPAGLAHIYNRFIPVMLLVSLTALFFLSTFFVYDIGSASAQSARNHRQGVLIGQRQKRTMIRTRRQIVRKSKPSFFQGLFGAPKQRRRTGGLKPLLSSLQGPAILQTNPAALRASYARRMRAAAQRDARLRNARKNGGLNAGARGPRRARRSNPNRSSAGWGRGKYRTMCVRMCDGFYFPIRFKARSAQFKGDEERCNMRCDGAPAKLFYYSNPGSSIENMRSLDGQRYKDLANAFKYRKEFVADCRCKADPWSVEAKNKHQNWAQAEKTVPRDGLIDDEDALPEQKTAEAVEEKPASSTLQY